MAIMKRLNCLKNKCYRYKWLILLLAWLTAHMVLNHKEDKAVREAKVRTKQPRFLKQETKPATIKQYDVILNSYMRSGSTLLGLVLGFRDDTFYMYEPLWKISRWTYWRGNSTVCRQDTTECRSLGQAMDVDKSFAKNENSSGGSLLMAKKILTKIYDCVFNDFERLVVEANLTAKLGGPSWEAVKSCSKRIKNDKFCLHKHAPSQCKQSSHKVSKVLRLTVDNLETFLRTRDNLKILHLFRDPRAIMNSRIKTNWYPAKTEPEILENAQALCSKMMYDYKTGVEIMDKYKHRFRFIFYEDFSLAPLEKAKTLYKYLGMSLNTIHYKRVTQATVFKSKKGQTERQKDTALWWRKTLDWNIVKQIDSICGDVLKALGYISFQTEAELRNLTQPSFVISRNHTL